MGRLQSAGRAASSWPPGATTEAIATRRHKAQRWNPSQPAATLSGQRRSCSKALASSQLGPSSGNCCWIGHLPPSFPSSGGRGKHSLGNGGQLQISKMGNLGIFQRARCHCTVLQCFAVLQSGRRNFRPLRWDLEKQGGSGNSLNQSLCTTHTIRICTTHIIF